MALRCREDHPSGSRRHHVRERRGSETGGTTRRGASSIASRWCPTESMSAHTRLRRRSVSGLVQSSGSNTGSRGWPSAASRSRRTTPRCSRHSASCCETILRRSYSLPEMDPCGKELEAAIGDLGLRNDVALLGLRTDVRDLLQASDAYVMSSAWEGLPIALLEAAASTLPIVATAVGGNAEVVLDGISGLIVPPRDPAALASAMVAIMSFDEAHRAELGTAGRSHVRNATVSTRSLRPGSPSTRGRWSAGQRERRTYLHGIHTDVQPRSCPASRPRQPGSADVPRLRMAHR